MIYDLKPVGQGSAIVVRVENTNDKPITIEVAAERRTFDENGAESRTPADDDFVLFPPQAVIQPGATQALRVQYVGPPRLPASVMYTVTVKQIPIQLPAGGPSGVQFVFNFSTLADVVPDGARAQIETVSLTPQPVGYALRIHNSGNKYANLAISSVVLTGPGFTRTLEGEDWRKTLGPSWILPGADRVIKLPAIEGAPAAGLTATVRLVESKP